MRFDLVAAGLNVAPLLHSIEARPHLWDEITVRQDYPGSAHRDTRCIWVRGPLEITEHSVFNDLVAVDYPAVGALGSPLRTLLDDVQRLTQAREIGRVLIVSLAPGGAIDRHRDEGAYAGHYSRVHVPLQSDAGNLFEVEDEVEHMQPGELWWFNHRREHEVRNDSYRERWHVIVDLVADRFGTPEVL